EGLGTLPPGRVGSARRGLYEIERCYAGEFTLVQCLRWVYAGVLRRGSGKGTGPRPAPGRRWGSFEEFVEAVDEEDALGPGVELGFAGLSQALVQLVGQIAEFQL